ncbi:transporter, auxin efflux carrier domain protein [Clostridium sp. MSTE9]|uniref:AEC family transporter n=1 Tax=Clostridium sp. (strain MSTE9) TaxID=1105031 RepID=UPI00026F3E3A|nr:AEC family transporter [Clostridium sp. MSTE9]EJF40490.1 transporter, auxin efflux carrier domain protein [Clostridium sp. MSTE9]
MDNLILSAEVIAPLCTLMALGYFVKMKKMIGDQTVDQLNNLVFRIFLPTMLFYNIYQTHLSGMVRPRLMIYGFIAMLCMYFLSILIVLLTLKDNRQRGAVAQASFRSNFVIFGLPVTASLFGPEKAGITALLISLIVPMYNFLSVILLEVFRGQKIQIGSIAKKIVTNPLIIGAVLGLSCLFFGIRLPNVAEKIVGDIAGSATPLALIGLGASFSFADTRVYRKPLIIGVFNRLILAPLLFLSVAVALGFRNEELAALMGMLGAPAAVSSYTMAQQMGSDGKLAGQLVVYTSICSIVTMFLLIFGLKQLGVM